MDRSSRESRAVKNKFGVIDREIPAEIQTGPLKELLA